MHFRETNIHTMVSMVTTFCTWTLIYLLLSYTLKLTEMSAFKIHVLSIGRFYFGIPASTTLSRDFLEGGGHYSDVLLSYSPAINNTIIVSY